jgi:hypothetical protein
MTVYVPQRAAEPIQQKNNSQFFRDLYRLDHRLHTEEADPSGDDDGVHGFEVGSLWVNTLSDTLYVLLDNRKGAAIWVPLGFISGGGTSTLDQLRIRVDDFTNLFSLFSDTFQQTFTLPLDTTIGGTGSALGRPAYGESIRGDGTGRFALTKLISVNELPEGLYNCSASYTSGRYKLIGANGSPFSQTNPGVLRIKNLAGTALQTFFLTTDSYLFDDATASDSDIIGEEFGTTAGVAWGNSRPFGLYFCNPDDLAPFAFLSPDPTKITTPASANNIGFLDNVAATPSDTNIFAFTPVNVTSATSKPCSLVGGISMTKNASDDWTAQAINGEGPGRFSVFGQKLTMPAGQKGASAGSFFSVAAGTAPTYTSVNSYLYSLEMTGYVNIWVECVNAAGGTAGAGAASLVLSTPYSNNLNAIVQDGAFNGRLVNSGTHNTLMEGRMGTSSSDQFLYQSTLVNGLTVVQGAHQNAAAREFHIIGRYVAF